MIVFFRDRFHSGPLPVNPASPWLRHGLAVFETLLWDRGRVVHLDRHLARAAAGLDLLGLGALPEGLPELMAETVERNRLSGGTSRVSLYLGPETDEGPLLPLVVAEPWTVPPPEPVQLALAEDLHLSWLARAKTASYAPFHVATRRARAAGAWDAVLRDGEGHVLETGRASLLFQDGEGSLVTPGTPWKLPGVAVAAVADAEMVVEEPILLEDLDLFPRAWVLNSLVGALPVARLGDRTFGTDPGVTHRLRAIVLETGPGTSGLLPE
ncbi:MAG: aminotransferase class IV [Deltaproteobacteria bacterium]|nr:aminotransferase class IV [Deltaproteobacteria bacterium]